eukprot:3757561-Alexandrium_andersonii.AAC.1
MHAAWGRQRWNEGGKHLASFTHDRAESVFRINRHRGDLARNWHHVRGSLDSTAAKRQPALVEAKNVGGSTTSKRSWFPPLLQYTFKCNIM